MARGVMRRKAAVLEETLDCSFLTEEYALVLAMMLDGTTITPPRSPSWARSSPSCASRMRQVAQLDGITGFGVRNAQDLIAGIGVDRSAFPTAGHLYSWARVATATVDRLTHHAHLVLTKGDSHRLAEAFAGKGAIPLAI